MKSAVRCLTSKEIAALRSEMKEASAVMKAELAKRRKEKERSVDNAPAHSPQAD